MDFARQAGCVFFRLMLVVSCLFTASAAIAAPVDDAKILLKQGKAAESMELLELHLVDYSQDPEYNYLLGISSLDAGKPGNAVFAFERVLAINPDHLWARAELARALIALTEYEAARRELTQVKMSPLPPDVAARVDEILAQLERALAQPKGGKGATTIAAYIEGEYGYDTNINTAPDSATFIIPGLNLIFTNNSQLATAQKSSLLGINGGVSVQKRINETIDVYGNVDGRFRYHPNQKDFAVGALAGGVGVRFTKGIDQYSFGLTQYTYYIDKYRIDDDGGVYGQWLHELSRQNMVGVFGQYIHLNHPIDTLLNTDLSMVGGIWSHAFLSSGDPVIKLTAYMGDDKERNNIPTIGRTLYGIKGDGEYKLREGLKLFGSVAVLHSRFGGQLFGTKQEDWRYDLNAGIAYKPSREWTVTPQLNYTRNASNISIKDFDRKQIIVNVRRDF